MNILFYTLALFFCSPCAWARHPMGEEATDEMIGEIFDLLNSGDGDIVEENLGNTVTRASGTCTVFEYIDLLTGQVAIGGNRLFLQNVLQHPMYRKSYALHARPIEDLPALEPFIEKTWDWSVCANIFYNQTSRRNFTLNSTSIESYIALTDPDLLELIDFDIWEDVSIPESIGLFRNTALQERRVGVNLGVTKRHNRWALLFEAPAYYLERNIYLTPDEQLRIENSPFATDVIGDPGSNNLVQFQKQFLICDQMGLGDTRIIFTYAISEDYRLTIDFGAEITIPTAWQWAKDFFGTVYNKQQLLPNFSLGTLMNLALCSDQTVQAQTLGTANMERALQILMVNLLDEPLGQEHWSFGPVLTTKFLLGNQGYCRMSAAVDYFVPSIEERYLLPINVPSVYDLDWESISSGTLAEANAGFELLANGTYSFLYPDFVLINVKPGFIAKFTALLGLDGDTLHSQIGYNLWYRTREKLGMLTHVQTPPIQPFDFSKGRAPYAFQNKIFGKLFGTYYSGSTEWRMGVCADWTFYQRGIGKDWTLSLDIVADF